MCAVHLTAAPILPQQLLLRVACDVYTPNSLRLTNTRNVRYGVALQDALAADTGRDYMRILLSIVNGNKDSLKDVDSHK
jgi:hypothetical protein